MSEAWDSCVDCDDPLTDDDGTKCRACALSAEADALHAEWRRRLKDVRDVVTFLRCLERDLYGRGLPKREYRHDRVRLLLKLRSSRRDAHHVLGRYQEAKVVADEAGAHADAAAYARQARVA